MMSSVKRHLSGTGKWVDLSKEETFDKLLDYWVLPIKFRTIDVTVNITRAKKITFLIFLENITN